LEKWGIVNVVGKGEVLYGSWMRQVRSNRDKVQDTMV